MLKLARLQANYYYYYCYSILRPSPSSNQVDTDASTTPMVTFHSGTPMTLSLPRRTCSKVGKVREDSGRADKGEKLHTPSKQDQRSLCCCQGAEVNESVIRHPGKATKVGERKVLRQDILSKGTTFRCTDASPGSTSYLAWLGPSSPHKKDNV